jgi:hypothetical protein
MKVVHVVVHQGGPAGPDLDGCLVPTVVIVCCAAVAVYKYFFPVYDALIRFGIPESVVGVSLVLLVGVPIFLALIFVSVILNP